MGCKFHMKKRHDEDFATNESTHYYEGCPGCQKATDHIVRDVVDLANCGEESDTHTSLTKGKRGLPMVLYVGYQHHLC